MTFHLNLADAVCLGVYRAVTTLIAPLLGLHLKKRVKHGKEHSDRWREKQGFAGRERPKGSLIWLNAVGLGEVMALRGLIMALNDRNPKLQFLVTSSTLISASTFANNLPPNTIHQFLPLDSPAYNRRFLDHWMPNLAIWSEQDIWPGTVHQTLRRGIPQALINARMNEKSYRIRAFIRPLYRGTYKKLSLISAQNHSSAASLEALGAPKKVRNDGSLKPNCPPLFFNADAQNKLIKQKLDKIIWLAASCHPEDENIALAAQQILLAKNKDHLLILAPRNPNRTSEILTKLGAFNVKVRSLGELPDKKTEIYLADTFSEMGLWYTNSKFALIGGTFSAVEGHNPWEALQLGCGVMHGPHFANFSADFEILKHKEASSEVLSPQDIVEVITSPDTTKKINYEELSIEMGRQLKALVDDILTLTML